MNFFRKLFRIRSKQEEGPFPNRALQLPHDVTPENGEKLAALFADSVHSIESITLDYTPESLEFVDKFLLRFRNEGVSLEQLAETIFVAGCYAGQVMVQQDKGQWVNSADIGLPSGVTMMPIVIQLKEDSFCDPITKAYKRFHNGAEDSMVLFYNYFTTLD